MVRVREMGVFEMASKTVRYTPRFKRQMVDLVRGGRTTASLTRRFRTDLRFRETRLMDPDEGRADGLDDGLVRLEGQRHQKAFAQPRAPGHERAVGRSRPLTRR